VTRHGGPAGPTRAWIRTLRPHQWAKNLLLFLPAVSAHAVWSPSLVAHALTAFASFCLGASATYIINDLVDLPHDRAHHSKRHRPIAAGELSVRTGLATVLIFGVASLALATLLPPDFAIALVAYLGLTLTYTAILKRQSILDVVALASLYALRLVAGGAMANVPLTGWFLAFSVFFFLSLALVKRVSEVHQRPTTGSEAIPGRGYVTQDLPVLTALGVGSAMASALVYCLYITGEDVRRLYAHPMRLWGGLPILLYWLGRVWLLAGRGAVHEDPVVFALRDRVSAVAFVAFLAVMLYAVR
jgi:4-hydroxybenzoate polyprenyltransferase